MPVHKCTQHGEQTGGVRSPRVVAELMSLRLQSHGGMALLTGALQPVDRSVLEKTE